MKRNLKRCQLDVSGLQSPRCVANCANNARGYIGGQMGTPAASSPYFTSGTFSGWGQYIGDVTEPINDCFAPFIFCG